MMPEGTTRTNPALAPAITSLDRLATAISRLVTRHGFRAVQADEADGFSPEGKSLLLLTDDPQRNLEVLDACVILPEAMKSGGGDLPAYVADASASPVLMKRFGITRAPAVVFLDNGQMLGSLPGIRDWAEYRHAFEQLLANESPGNDMRAFP